MIDTSPLDKLLKKKGFFAPGQDPMGGMPPMPMDPMMGMGMDPSQAPISPMPPMDPMSDPMGVDEDQIRNIVREVMAEEKGEKPRKETPDISQLEAKLDQIQSQLSELMNFLFTPQMPMSEPMPGMNAPGMEPMPEEIQAPVIGTPGSRREEDKLLKMIQQLQM